MVGHRYYNPEWGRWIQPDDVEYLEPDNINGLNLYCYCQNNPIAYRGFDDSRTASEIIVSLNGDTLYFNNISLGKTNTVKQSSWFLGWYRGVPVLKNPFPFVDRSFSFGGIFLAGEDYANYLDNPKLIENTLKHEWGHVVQFILLGPIKYFTYIGIPSMFKLGNREYYLKPWEITAEFFGGVQSGNYEYKTEDYLRGFAYLAVSIVAGPLSYLFLLGEYN